MNGRGGVTAPLLLTLLFPHLESCDSCRSLPARLKANCLDDVARLRLYCLDDCLLTVWTTARLGLVMVKRGYTGRWSAGSPVIHHPVCFGSVSMVLRGIGSESTTRAPAERPMVVRGRLSCRGLAPFVGWLTTYSRRAGKSRTGITPINGSGMIWKGASTGIWQCSIREVPGREGIFFTIRKT